MLSRFVSLLLLLQLVQKLAENLCVLERCCREAIFPLILYAHAFVCVHAPVTYAILAPRLTGRGNVDGGNNSLGFECGPGIPEQMGNRWPLLMYSGASARCLTCPFGRPCSTGSVRRWKQEIGAGRCVCFTMSFMAKVGGCLPNPFVSSSNQSHCTCLRLTVCPPRWTLMVSLMGEGASNTCISVVCVHLAATVC